MKLIFLTEESVSVDILKQIKELGLKIIILSSKSENKAEFTGICDNICNEDEDIVEIIENFGFNNDECLFVGCRETDIVKAKKAGVCSIGALWKYENWDELQDAKPSLLTMDAAEVIRACKYDSVNDFCREGYIPYYWKEHIDEKIEKIKNDRTKAGENSISFGLISDVHWSKGRIRCSAALLEKIVNECDVTYVLNAGDTVSGAGICGADLLFSQLSGYSNEFKCIEEKTLMAQGNHDPAYCEDISIGYYNQNITKAELYEYIFKYETKYSDRVMSDDGSYFYADSNIYKTRFIVMNPYDVPSDEADERGIAKYSKMRLAGYRQTQLEWLANEALNVPSNDWTVILCTHINPSSKVECYNDDIILGLINAYRNSKAYEKESVNSKWPEYNVHINADFTDRGGEFAVWVSGHLHCDAVKVVDDTLCISIISDWNHQQKELGFDRTAGTVMEHAFDIFTLDTENHKLYVTRIGAGENREFDYVANSKNL